MVTDLGLGRQATGGLVFGQSWNRSEPFSPLEHGLLAGYQNLLRTLYRSQSPMVWCIAGDDGWDDRQSCWWASCSRTAKPYSVRNGDVSYGRTWWCLLWPGYELYHMTRDCNTGYGQTWLFTLTRADGVQLDMYFHIYWQCGPLILNTIKLLYYYQLNNVYILEIVNTRGFSRIFCTLLIYNYGIIYAPQVNFEKSQWKRLFHSIWKYLCVLFCVLN